MEEALLALILVGGIPVLFTYYFYYISKFSFDEIRGPFEDASWWLVSVVVTVFFYVFAVWQFVWVKQLETNERIVLSGGYTLFLSSAALYTPSCMVVLETLLYIDWLTTNLFTTAFASLFFVVVAFSSNDWDKDLEWDAIVLIIGTIYIAFHHLVIDAFLWSAGFDKYIKEKKNNRPELSA